MDYKKLQELNNKILKKLGEKVLQDSKTRCPILPEYYNYPEIDYGNCNNILRDAVKKAMDDMRINTFKIKGGDDE
jgi:hypothetical protein